MDTVEFPSGVTISHLLYMDDIKRYAKKERDVDSLIHLTRIYSGRQDSKHTRHRQIAYLGIPQVNGSHEEKATRTATTKYLQEVRQVLRTQPNGRNKIHEPLYQYTT